MSGSSTPAKQAVLDLVDAAFGFGAYAKPLPTREETVARAIAGWERMIADLQDRKAAHAEWRAAMAIKNPGALALYADRGPILQATIERYERCIRDAKASTGVSAPTVKRAA